MTAVSTPDTRFNLTADKIAVENAPQRILFIGQKLASGTATAGALTSVGVNGEQGSLFGRDSFLATGIREFRKINSISQVDAIALDDLVAGVAATSVGTFSGTATADASWEFSIQSASLYTFTLEIKTGDTAAQIATSAAALVNAQTDMLVTASGTSPAMTLTCKHKGTIGNTISLYSKTKDPAPGITFNFSVFTGGAGDPVLTNIFNVVANSRYQTIVYPANYLAVVANLTALKDFVNSRFNPAGNIILDGVALLTMTDTSAANFKATAASFNSQSVVLFPNLSTSNDFVKGGVLRELDFATSSKIAAIRTLRLTKGAPVSQYVTGATAAGQSTGGIEYSTVPYGNTPMPGMNPIPTGLGFSFDEISDLKGNGVAIIGNNDSANGIILGTVVTTQKTINGQPSKTYEFLSGVDGSSSAREYFTVQTKAIYSQTKLSQGDIVSGLPMANQQTIKAKLVEFYDELATFGVTPSGRVAEKFFRDNLAVVLDFSSDTLNIVGKLPIVSGVTTIIGNLNVTFDLNG